MSKDMLTRAKAQRYIALRNAIDTVDAFAVPTLSPEQMRGYMIARNALLTQYLVNNLSDYTLND